MPPYPSRHGRARSLHGRAGPLHGRALALTFAALLALSGCAALGAGSGAEEAATPGPQDIPQPVPADVDLAGEARPDIVRFLHVRTATDPSLSPDGMEVAFSSQISGAPQLWVVDSRGGWPRQLTFGESATFHDWSPTGDWILYGQDRGGDEREGFYLIDPSGTPERELLAPSRDFRVFGAFTRDGRRLVYAATRRGGLEFDIHTLDVETGRDRRIFQGRMGLYAASFRPDGGAVLLTEARGEDAADVYLYDVRSRSLDTLFRPDDRARHASFSWEPGGGGFYLVTNQDREFTGLARYELETRELRYLDDYLAPQDLEREVESVALSRDGRYLAWTVNEEGWSRLHIRDLETGSARAPSYLPRGVYEIDWAPEGPVLAIAVRSPTVPGDIWTIDLRTSILHRATRSDAAGLDLSRMVVPTHQTFRARDGVEIYGLLYEPLPSARSAAGGAADRPPPVVLAVHGGPTAQARPTFNPAHQFLLARGIAVFDLNYRGSTGYGKTFERLNDGRLRDNELGDLEDALRWLGERGWVDSSRAAIMGGSYGGYLTMAALTRLPRRFRAGVAFVGVSNWITALEGASPQLQASDRVEYGDIHDPEDRAFFRRISPLTWVDSIQAPIMVLHGANDPRDPVEESDQFVRAIRERGGEVEYLRFPDEGHSIRKLENRVIAYRRIADFLERELRPR